jgi:hypothetical protein
MKIPRVAIVLTAINLLFLLSNLAQARSSGTQAVTPVVRARALELVDEHGQIRSRLNVESNGEVVLRLLDQEGTIRVKLGAAKDGSGLLLINDATEPGVHILAKATGSSLKLANKDGRQRVFTPSLWSR